MVGSACKNEKLNIIFEVFILKLLLQFFFVPGPGNWGGECGTGKKQSPIDINTANTTLDETLGTFTMKNYNKKLTITFTGFNNGRALELSFPEKVYNVSGGVLAGVYTTVQFHFHWGPDNSVGSEHTVNGKEYAAEVSDSRKFFCQLVINSFLFVISRSLFFFLTSLGLLFSAHRTILLLVANLFSSCPFFLFCADRAIFPCVLVTQSFFLFVTHIFILYLPCSLSNF